MDHVPAAGVHREGDVKLPRTGTIGLATAIASLVYWAVTSLLVHAVYFGDKFAVAAREGYFAVYWSNQNADQNTQVLNCFGWPYFPSSGAGAQWYEEAWGRWYVEGPDSLLSHDWLRYLAQYPQRLGFYLPGVGDYNGVGYVGVPAWCVGLCGLAVWLLARRRRWRRGKRGLCRRCGYNLVGLAAGSVCPECGS
jgi:hypothetical protein